MSKKINNIKDLEFEFDTLKQKLRKEGISFRSNKEYRRLQLAIFRSKKKIATEETSSSKSLPIIQNNSSPINVMELSEKIQSENLQKININLINTNKETLPITEKNLIDVINKENLQKININLINTNKETLPITEKNLIDVINKENLLIIQKNLTNIISKESLLEIKKNAPGVRKVLTLAEKELLLVAKKSSAHYRAYMQNRSLTDPERSAVWKTVDQPPTAYDEDLLALMKLYPVVFSRFPNEGEKPRQVFAFGEDEATFRCLDKYKLFFPKRWPKSHETVSIDRETELERAESELLFLKGLLKNSPEMKKNTAFVEKIAFLTLSISKTREYLSLHPVPTKPS